MGTFIVVEGGEGCGKSTQAQILYERLLRQGHPGLLLHEPGGTPVGDQIRRLLKSQRGEAQKPQPRGRQFNLSPMAELLLFSAARAELVNHVLSPALDRGHIVVCDRYTPSTIAYQGFGHELGYHFVSQLQQLIFGNFSPGLTFLLSIDAKEGVKRAKARGDSEVRYEEMEKEFHERVDAGFKQVARDYGERVVVIDASGSVESIHAEVVRVVNDRYGLEL